MRSVGLIALLFVVTAPAFAAPNAASIGRGWTGIAVTNEDATGIANPAALPQLGTWCGDEVLDDGVNGKAADAEWLGQLGYAQDMEGFDDEWVLNLAARRLDQDWGFGLGYGEIAGGIVKRWYASYGKQWVDKGDNNGWFWGATVLLPDTDFGPDHVMADLGLLYVNKTPLLGGGRWSFGLVGRDVTDEYGDYQGAGFSLDAGIAVTWPRTRLAVDLIDVFDDLEIPEVSDTGSYVDAGLEYAFNRHFIGRVGVTDGDFSWGGTLRYKRLSVDFGHADYDWTNWEGIGVRYNFTYDIGKMTK